MANADSPGFIRAANEAASNLGKYTAGETIAKDDIVVITGGKVYVYDASTDVEILGVAAHAAVEDGDILVANDPAAEWVMQCSGTYVAATYDGARVDLEGGTGAAEVNENATVTGSVYVIGHAPQPGATATGANARVRVRFVGHALASAPESDPGTSVFDAVSTDTISEKTSAAGVTVDGCLLKDGGSIDVAARINSLDNGGDGYTAVIDVAAATAATLTDSSGGSADTTVAAITNAANAGSADVGPVADGFADVVAQINALTADVALIRTAVNGILADLRVTGGAGVIED